MPAIQKLQPVSPGPRATVIELRTLPGLQDIGDATASFACPDCGALLLERVEPGKLTELAFRCPACGALSCVTPPRRH